MRYVVPVVVGLLVVAGVSGAVLLAPGSQVADPPTRDPTPTTHPTNDSVALVTSDSATAFRAYQSRSRAVRSHDYLLRSDDVATEQASSTPMATSAAGDAAAAGAAPVDSSGGAPRYGETNVQVEGVDEPDVLKTVDGRFYYSMPRRHVHSHDGTASGTLDGTTVAVDATTPGSASITAEIDRSGRMLVQGDRLVVVGDDAIAGYDVSDPDDPRLEWEREIPGHVTAARLYDGQVYLVVSDRVDDDCRVEPLAGTTVPCTEIHHPRRPVPVDVTYTALRVGTADGAVQDRFAFVGGHRATVYMSTDGLYVTYLERTPTSELRLEYLLSDGRSLLDEPAIERLETVRDYDLSPSAERAEVRVTVQGWLRRQPADRRDELAERLADGYRDYLGEHKRQLDRTHVVRLSLDGGLEQAAAGSVPGRVLNQFSFSVHDGHLRVATTVGEGRGVESANDVYVLDVDDLAVEGSVTGMSEGQRVYGVRFVGDTGYVITYRQVDPLHVLDLSDPSDPEQTGKLKLPGFSSYLHPLDDGRLLGIGEEDGRVKAVVFDVSDPRNPTIEASRVLDARYSAVGGNHHAFMRDARHGVFFLPTERGGYVLSEDDLSTVKRVDVADPRRARYAGDHLYVFGRERAVVIDERTWTRTDSVDLREE